MTELARRIVLYAQDAGRNITDRYTLTAPRMVVESPVARIEGGPFDGDVVFSSAAYRESADVDEDVVTGEITVE